MPFFFFFFFRGFRRVIVVRRSRKTGEWKFVFIGEGVRSEEKKKGAREIIANCFSFVPGRNASQTSHRGAYAYNNSTFTRAVVCIRVKAAAADLPDRISFYFGFFIYIFINFYFFFQARVYGERTRD